MSKKLNNAPVYYTVAQVQFNPILNLDGYLPAIQAKMREAHFPDFKHELFQRLVLPFGGMAQGQMAAPAVTPQSRYLFGDIAGRSLFLLETNVMSFQTTDYETFETFSAILLKGLGTLHEVMRLDFVERIGLRYLDAVQPSKESESLRDFLVPEVLGLALRGEGELQHAISETIVATPAGQSSLASLFVAGTLDSRWNSADSPRPLTLVSLNGKGCMPLWIRMHTAPIERSSN